MKRILINERKQKVLLSAILNESLIGDLSDKVLKVKKYLDDNIIRADINSVNDKGEPTKEPIAAWLDKGSKDVLQTFKDYQLIDFLEEQFKNIMPSREETRKFLKKVAIAWYKNKITKNGSILDN